MTVDYNFDEKSEGSKKNEKIVSILTKFKELSPEKQKEVMKYINFLISNQANKKGQDPSS